MKVPSAVLSQGSCLFLPHAKTAADDTTSATARALDTASPTVRPHQCLLHLPPFLALSVSLPLRPGSWISIRSTHSGIQSDTSSSPSSPSSKRSSTLRCLACVLLAPDCTCSPLLQRPGAHPLGSCRAYTGPSYPPFYPTTLPPALLPFFHLLIASSLSPFLLSLPRFFPQPSDYDSLIVGPGKPTPFNPEAARLYVAGGEEWRIRKKKWNCVLVPLVAAAPKG